MNDPNSKLNQASRPETISATGANSLLDRLQSVTASTTLIGPRRTPHGGCAWSLPSRGDFALRQPQDGAIANSGHSVSSNMLNALRLKHPAPATADANDDKLTGATRSLSSRLLGLNGMHRKPLLDADTERYFAEHTPNLRGAAIRKGPEITRKFGRMSAPHTNVA